MTATGAEDRGEYVAVTVDGAESAARYVVACTGGRSRAREWVGAAFEGHGGPQAMLIADVRVEGLTPDRWYQWPAPNVGFIMLCPFRGSDVWQFQGALWTWFGPDGLPEPTRERLQAAVDEVVGNELLDSYAEERIPIARWTLGISSDRLEEMSQTLAGKTSATRDTTLADGGQQLGLGYRWSPLSAPTSRCPSAAPGHPWCGYRRRRATPRATGCS